MERELQTFETGASASAQAEAFSRLVKLKQHHQAAKDARFDRGIERLARALRESDDPVERTSAAATLLRIAALIKPWTGRISKQLADGLIKPLPALATAFVKNDREDIASCWRFVTQPWIKSYLAAGAVEEEAADKVRMECVEGVLSLSDDLASALVELTDPVRRLTFDTEKPGDSKARRVRRVLCALNSIYSSSPKEPGENAGAALRRFVVEAMQNVPPVIKPEVTDELTEEILRLIRGIVSARFSCVTSDGTYTAMEVVRSWYRDYSWEDFAERSPSAKVIARDLEAALELLVRAGVADDKLYSRLTLACGGPSRAREVAIRVLERNPGLPEDLARWLSGSPSRQKSAFALETEAAHYDELLADLLLDCTRLRGIEEAFERDSMPEINVVAPQAASGLSRFLGVTRAIRNAVETAARLRSLALRGHVGDVVSFSPLEHEMAGGLRPGVRTVRIVRPAIEAASAVGGRRIVRKAVVESTE